MTGRILLTVDTEALPNRASDSHVERLIWGRFRGGGAGIEEMVAISEILGIPFLFLLEMAASAIWPAEIREVASYLKRVGQEVELHLHPEILGEQFWRDRGLGMNRLRQDLFTESDAHGTLSWGCSVFENIVGYHPTAYRAGSFRWNAWTIKVMSELGMRVSLNSCRETASDDNYATYSSPDCLPFQWENGVIEIPCGEFIYKNEIMHLRYPRRTPKGLDFSELISELCDHLPDGAVAVVLLHSWSFLDRDKESGHFVWKDDRRLQNFYKAIEKLKRNYEFIGFSDLFSTLHLDECGVRDLSDLPKPE